MAEALALIGLASNIIGFVELGIQFVSVTLSLVDARKIPEVEELDTILVDIQLRHDKLRKCMESSKVKPSKADSNILNMVQQCHTVADRLRDLFKKLFIRPEARFPTADSVRVAVNLMVNKKEIHELRQRLMRMDTMIRGDQHSEISQKLDAVNRSYKEFGIDYDVRLTEIRNEVISAITNMSRRNQMVGLSIYADELQSLKTKLVTLENELTICDTQAEIIQSLYFKEIKRRWSLIPKSEEKTNSWLFDREKTNFAFWAKSEEVSAIYCISGLAGSGKSTLMKFASDHPETQELLEEWARPFKLCKASYFFWNQGFEKQKSKTGLLQSLLYQILRHNPELAPIVNTASGRQHYETWDFAELESAFEQIVSSTNLKTRFCFFIDGLDEYGGEDEEISSILLSMIKSPHIKICASSRPRTVFDDKLWSDDYRLKIQDLTKDDMRVYVRSRLVEIPRFLELSGSERAAEDLMNHIAKHARGVWLWVFLVARDLKHALNRKEGLSKLQNIVDSLPRDLAEYFARIISNIKPAYRDEMARMFLAALEGVQPLPLLAFALLVREVSDPDYATTATVSSMASEEGDNTLNDWKARMHNRCGDLLVVEDGDHTTLFDCPVDFLHRTVRDFLQDCYHKSLKSELRSSFDPSLSLCRVMLYFLKKHPGITNSGLKDTSSLNSIITVVDQVLYHAHEVESHDENANPALMCLLDQVDQVVSTIHAKGPRAGLARLRSTGNHWTCARDSPRARGLDEYHEGGNCNYIALTVQARLVQYVRTKLATNPAHLRKPGRPLLDYALRPHRVTPLMTPYHTNRDEPNINVEMVGLLLKAGADPNQKVYLNGDRSVWALFLISCAESTRRKEANEVWRDAWERASEMMIEYGAKSDCFGPVDEAGLLGVGQELRSIFGKDKADELMQKMRQKDKERSFKSWAGWLYNQVVGRE